MTDTIVKTYLPVNESRKLIRELDQYIASRKRELKKAGAKSFEGVTVVNGKPRSAIDAN